MHGVQRITDSTTAEFAQLIDDLALEDLAITYEFVTVERLEQITLADSGNALRIYWTELLARAHMTAVTGIMRSRHWYSAIVAAEDSQNIFAFAAALRGLIESSADTYSSLQGIPMTLTRDHSQILTALLGRATDGPINNDFEDRLIHYSHARYIPRSDRPTVPYSHVARSTQAYLEILNRSQVSHIDELYRLLCDLVHPAAPSVWMWLRTEQQRHGEHVHFSPGNDGAIIADVAENYSDTLHGVMKLAFEPAALTLMVLNYFPVAEFHVPALLNWNVPGFPEWEICQERMANVPT